MQKSFAATQGCENEVEFDADHHITSHHITSHHITSHSGYSNITQQRSRSPSHITLVMCYIFKYLNSKNRLVFLYYYWIS